MIDQKRRSRGLRDLFEYKGTFLFVGQDGPAGTEAGRWGQGIPAHPVGGPVSPVPTGPSRPL